ERQRDVGGEIDEVVEPGSVEAGHHFLDADHPGEGAVGGVDEGGEDHEGEGETVGFHVTLEDEDGHGCGTGESEGGVEVDAPGEDDAHGRRGGGHGRGTPASQGSGEGVLWFSWNEVNQGEERKSRGCGVAMLWIESSPGMVPPSRESTG